MEEEKGMERSRQIVRGREPNKAEVHRKVPDGPLDGLSRTPNHAITLTCESKYIGIIS